MENCIIPDKYSIAAGSIVVAVHAKDSTKATLQYSITKDDSGLFALARIDGTTYVTMANTSQTMQADQVYIVTVQAENPDNELKGKILWLEMYCL